MLNKRNQWKAQVKYANLLMKAYNEKTPFVYKYAGKKYRLKFQIGFCKMWGNTSIALHGEDFENYKPSLNWRKEQKIR